MCSRNSAVEVAPEPIHPLPDFDGAAKGGKGSGTEPNRWVGFLRGPGADGDIFHIPELPFEGHAVRGPESLHQFQAFDEAGEAVLGSDSEGGILFPVHTYGESKDEPAIGKLVQAGHGLGKENGVPEGEGQGGDSQLYPGSQGCGVREQGYGFEVRDLPEDSLADPCAIVAEGFDGGEEVGDVLGVYDSIGKLLGDGYAEPSFSLASHAVPCFP